MQVPVTRKSHSYVSPTEHRARFPSSRQLHDSHTALVWVCITYRAQNPLPRPAAPAPCPGKKQKRCAAARDGRREVCARIRAEGSLPTAATTCSCFGGSTVDEEPWATRAPYAPNPIHAQTTIQTANPRFLPLKPCTRLPNPPALNPRATRDISAMPSQTQQPAPTPSTLHLHSKL